MEYSIDLKNFIDYTCDENDYFDVEKLKRDAANGNNNAQLVLGTIFLNGNNVLEKNETYAIYWWKKSAKQGNSAAQEYLAYTYTTVIY